MRKLWYLSLVVLLLGNAIDAGATYLGVLDFGLEYEGNLLVRHFIMGRLGTGFLTFVIVKLLVGSVLLLLVWYYPVLIRPWVGIRVSTFIGFLYGIVLALAGTGLIGLLFDRIALLLFSEEAFFTWAETPSAPLVFHGIVVGFLVIVSTASALAFEKMSSARDLG